MPSVGQELLNVPFGEMVQQLALAVAAGQFKLDQNSTEVAKFMAQTNISLPAIPKANEVFDPAKKVDFPLIALGFFPGYYQFSKAIIEVKMAITMTQSTEFNASVGVSAKWGPVSASVNASYSSKYSYSVEGSSLLRIEMNPVPPPPQIQQYMEALIAGMKANIE